MADSRLQVRPARLSELDDVVRLCSEAFVDEAVLAWVIPDRASRWHQTRNLFTGSVQAAVEAGELIIAVTPEGLPVAASFWHECDANPTVGAGADPADEPEGADQVAQRRQAVSAATVARHPTEPHVFLSSMATLSEFRGRGAGAAMVGSGIARADALALPIYLEASTSQNRRLYLRHGFTDYGDPVPLPDGGPVLQPMWRPHG